jgi:hypothetical protein
MTVYSITPQYPVFTDLNGLPLESGYIWIGEANLNPITNPLTITWDIEGLYAAAQPIRTLAGYPVNNGTPGNLYVNLGTFENYSILIKDKKSKTVYYKKNVEAELDKNSVFESDDSGGVKTHSDINAVAIGKTTRVNTENALISALNNVSIFQIIINDNITLTGDLTLSKPVFIENGGKITTSGFTLNITSPLNAGEYDIFTASTTEITFSSGQNSIYVNWWDNSDDNDKVQSAINAVRAITRKPIIKFSSGIYDFGTNNVSFESNGIILEGCGRWNTSINYIGTGSAISITDKITSREFCKISNIGFLCDNSALNTAIDIRKAPNTILENIYILEYYRGILSQDAWNTSFNKILIAACRFRGFDIGGNTNDSCLVNCIATCDDSLNSRCVYMESCHGVSIKGGAFEEAEYAMQIDGCEVSIDCYMESNTSGCILNTTGSSTKINIVNLYTFNNGTGSLITMAAGTCILNQINDASPVTPARIFALSGGAKAWYGMLNMSSSIAIGTFDINSAGHIRPLNALPTNTWISPLIDASVNTDVLIDELNRPWKMIKLQKFIHSGTPLGASVSIGDTRGGTSVVNNQSIDNNDAQQITYIQTTGTYTNQQGNIFLRVTSGGGSTGIIQFKLLYYKGYPGNSPIPNPNQPDTYISTGAKGGEPSTAQFID